MPARFPDMSARQGPKTLVNGNGSAHPPGLEEEVVISGLSGRLPESSNIREFQEQLFAGVDLITDDDRRWPSGE